MSMLLGEDIICLSSIDWDFLWQGHQEIMSLFAAHGNRVLFVENTGVRRPRFSDFARLQQRIRNWRRGIWGVRQERENLYIYSPILLPFPYSRIAQWINRRIFLATLHRWMALMQARQPLVWTFLPTRLVLDVIRSIPHRLVIYYCIDNFEESSPEAHKKVRPHERQLLREADLVFVTSQALAERCEPDHGRPTHWFPFGVAMRHFPEASSAALPDDLAGLPAPRIGYVGGVHQWVDVPLLRTVSERLPDHSFVLVGPVQTDVTPLLDRPNVHLLGAKPHELLHAYIRHFDACLIPYRLTEYTRNVYPTKLNEYLILGKPVVSTPIPEVVTFNAHYEGAVRIADSPASFASHVRAAAAENGDRDSSRRQIALENSWERRVEAMSAVILDTLTRQARERQRRWREVLGVVYRHALQRIATPLAAALIVWSVLFHTPLIWWAAAPLRVAEAPRQADAIVVLAGGVGESGQVGQGYEERVNYAVHLYQGGYAPELVFSSGYKYIFEEAEVMKALAISLGVPSRAIVLDTDASNTYQNLVNTAAILHREGRHRALLVSSPYHMRRALLVARSVAPDLTVIPTPIPYSSFYGDRHAVRWRHLRAILREYASILYYWTRGYIHVSHAPST